MAIDIGDMEHVRGFVDECREHMAAIEGALLRVEQAPGDVARLNELFRPFHTIKGIAGFLHLTDVQELMHTVETALDPARQGQAALSAGQIEAVFGAVDALRRQVAALCDWLAAPQAGPYAAPDVSRELARLRGSDVGAGGGAPAPAADAVAAALRDMAGAERTIRVEAAKLDALVDAVSELVIAQSMVQLQPAADGTLQRNVGRVTKIVRDIQTTALALRMVPLGPTFARMRRLVRDVARQAGKPVRLEIAGEETELDKTVVQRIADPLVHLLRNAIDHGIEDPATRAAAGKPAEGRLRLAACHDGGSVVVSVQDDGRGLQRARILERAVERGLVPRGAQLSDAQALQLILLPGFSTAERISQISGRGVGLDVVRNQVEQLRGRVEIDSAPGRGSTFAMRLPLTLAIIDGMVLRVGAERLVVPTLLIEQALRPRAGDLVALRGRGELVRVRGAWVPLLQLGTLFGYAAHRPPAGALVVVVQCDAARAGLVVDELVGQQQVVIKPLDARFRGVRGVGGAAILGDGRVGLILDPAGLVAAHAGAAALPARAPSATCGPEEALCTR